MVTRWAGARTILLLSAIVAAPARAQPIDGANECVACHTDQLVAVAATGGHSPLVDCRGCHENRRPDRVGRDHRATADCVDCHAEPSGHPPRRKEPTGTRATRNCLRCHDVHGSTNLHLVSTSVLWKRRAFPITFTSETGAGPGGFTDPANPGRGLCEVCHRKTDVYRRDGTGEPHFTQPCTLCHVHGEHFEPVASDANCGICHTEEAARFLQPSGHGARFECSGCHAEVSPTPGDGHRAVEACETCHAGADNATHAPNGPPGMPCAQCHDPHGTGNLNLVRDVLTTTLGTQVPIRFDNLDGRAEGSFASPSAPGTGICEVCHTTTQHYRADGTGEPHFTFSCLPCHLHSKGFAP